MGTLDAVTANGPEGGALDWDSVDWSRAEDDVRRLRQRIFTASRAGDLRKVRSLQRLMLRSRANALVSVRRVTEVNAGRKTAGVDGRVVLASREKADLAVWLQHGAAAWKPRPVRRVYIPKANGKRRGLGIPVIADRALQALAVSALEPEWEARFESRSYGFRPGRSCQDAMQAAFVTARGKTCKRPWALDADLAAAFDRIDHDHLLGQLGSFPARGLVRAWLKAGVIDGGQLAPTERGSPQGGVVSPVLMNVALHGMEEAAGVRYITTGKNAGTARPGSPVLIRYADDVLAFCHSRQQAEQVKARLAGWLAPRGLAFNEDKTRVVHLDDGVDFLGFNVRRYRGKLLIKPSKAAVKRIRERLSAEMRALRGSNAQAVIIRLNPVVRGWSAYYRHCVSARVFNELDDHVWKLTYKWATWTHPHKGKRWTVSRYFGQFNPARRDRWVFGDRDSGAYLQKFAWTKITRHTLVKGRASPDDPDLTGYWAARRRRGRPPLAPPWLRMLQRQGGRCPLCGGLLLHADREPQHPDEWEQWASAVPRAITSQAIAPDTDPGKNGGPAGLRLIHTGQHSHGPGPDSLRACPSPVRRNGARRVPRGRRRGNAPPLPDWRIWYYLLEGAGLNVQLVNSSQARQLAGRPKTDRLDAQWIARLAEMGLLRPSFVPPPEIRALRDLTRTRLQLVRDRTREWQRLEKLLEGALVKLSSALSSLARTKTARTILEAIAGGERDPKALAALADKRVSGGRAAVARSLDGMQLGDHHAMLIRVHLDHITLLDRSIAAIEDEIEAALDAIPAAWGADATGEAGPHAGRGEDAAALPAVDRLAEIPGVSLALARAIIAETGLDMTRFPDAGRLVSWAGLAPVTSQSGPRTRRPGKGQGDSYLKGYCTQAANGAATTDTFLGERLRRLSKRIGGNRARCAVARSILVIVWHLLADPTSRYHDLGPGWHTRKADTDRRTRSLLNQLRALHPEAEITVNPTAA